MTEGSSGQEQGTASSTNIKAQLNRNEVVVGDTIIGSSKVGPGEVKEDPSLRWFRGINDANARPDISDLQKGQNIQEIINAAKAAGVAPDKVKAHLETLGIKVVEQQPPATTDNSRSINTLAKLADSVLAGTSNPAALQNYADYLVRGGMPKEQIGQILSSKGIDVQEKNEQQSTDQAIKLKELEIKLFPLLEKAQKAYPTALGGNGRFGAEIPLSNEDIILVKEAATIVGEILALRPEFRDVVQYISQHRAEKGFGEAYLFGAAITLDNTITKPQFGNFGNGVYIKLPSDVYQLWQIWNEMEGIRTRIDISSVRQGGLAKHYIPPLVDAIRLVSH